MMKMMRVFMGWMALAILFGACSTGSALQKVLGGSAEAPVFIACKTLSTQDVSFQFSLPVRVTSLRLEPQAAVESVKAEGDTVMVRFSQPLPAGERITADLLVEDEAGNTLNVLVPFRARNDRIPPVMITEIRTEYSKPKVEFVELKTIAAGNLGALRMFIASNGLDEPILEFPPVEVTAGEYLVIHLRTLDETVSNETGEDLGAVAYTKDNEAQPDARDFWLPESKKRITKKADAVILMDQDDRIIDAVLLSETADPWWKDDKLVRAAELLAKQGAWTAASGDIPGPADAVPSKDATATRSISRDETLPDSNTAADWFITATSNATPGKTNSVKRYVPKE